MCSFFFQSILLILKTIYYILESFVLFLIPLRFRKKSVVDEVVFITGGGSGLGRLMAQRFADLGSKVVVCDMNEAGNNETVDLIRRKGGKATGYKCDISNRTEVYHLATRIEKDVGRVTILVNNAGIVTGKTILESSDESNLKAMDVNINAWFWTIKAFLPHMLEKNHGHIVSVASAAGKTGTVGLADYCASKHAAVGFDESLRFDFHAMGKTGVFTTCVCPFYIDTGMFKGVRARVPFLLPILQPEFVVDRIMDAVLINQPEVYIPRLLYWTVALRHILPVKCSLLFSEYVGANSAMDSFVGRSKNS